MATILRALPEDTVKDSMKSPVGELWFVASKKGLHALLWDKDLLEEESAQIMEGLKKSPRHPVISKVRSQLKEYFSGKRTKFDIPLSPSGTQFQEKAWKQLRKIPFGKTISYQKQATWLGDAKKTRAVGGANGKNPISIIVPCHRVIGKNNSLTGFGGGLDRKRYLLDHEAKVAGAHH